MTKTVASLCPWRSWIERPLFSRVKTYMLEPIRKGDAPFTLRINDDIQWEKLLSVQPAISKTILGEEIAADLVLHTSMQGPFMDAEARPAIWICQGPELVDAKSPAEMERLSDQERRFELDRIASWNITRQNYSGPPTAAEIASETKKLKAYCGLVVEYADDLERRRANREAMVPKVTERMKDAARYLDLKRDWLTELVDASTMCPFCTHVIPSHAIKCPECKEVVNRPKYDELRKNGGKLPQEVEVSA